MTWIRTISPAEALGDVAQFYDAVAASRGGVAAIHVAQSLHPKAMRAHLELYKAVVLGRSALPRRTREQLAVVVSRVNGCEYCVRHHAAALGALGEAPDVVAALVRGDDPAGATDAERALAAWARVATIDPAGSRAEDLDRLRAIGLDDAAILDATLVVAYFCFVNRLVLLLGVELESGYEKTCT